MFSGGSRRGGLQNNDGMMNSRNKCELASLPLLLNFPPHRIEILFFLYWRTISIYIIPVIIINIIKYREDKKEFWCIPNNSLYKAYPDSGISPFQINNQWNWLNGRNLNCVSHRDKAFHDTKGQWEVYPPMEQNKADFEFEKRKDTFYHIRIHAINRLHISSTSVTHLCMLFCRPLKAPFSI